MRQGDTPYQVSPNAGLLRDQDEKRSVVRMSAAVMTAHGGVVLALPSR
jgi:hypothetical protein